MIQINQLDFSYKGKEKLFKNLDTSFEKGKIYGVLGKNGMGKSSLLKLIAGLIFPQNGAVLCDGIPTTKRSPDFLQKLFLLHEDFYLPPLTIANYIRAYSPFYSQFDKQKFREILSELGLENSMHLHEMSLGQKKKFSIAFGLATNAEYILMDEPTNGLDIPSKGQFRRLIASYVTDNQVLLICTHHIKDLANLLDHIVILVDGEIILSKSILEIEKRLLFLQSPILQEEALYSEMIPGSYIQLYENKHEESSQLELEVFFNAILNKREQIVNIFK